MCVCVCVCVHMWYGDGAYVNAASFRLSASALRSVLSRSITPHDACSTESRRQSPAVRFHSAYRRLPRTSVISTLQLMTCSSSSSSSATVHNSHVDSETSFDVLQRAVCPFSAVTAFAHNRKSILCHTAYIQ